MKRSTKDKSSENEKGSHSNGAESPNSDTDSEASQRLCHLQPNATPPTAATLAQYSTDRVDHEAEVIFLLNLNLILFPRLFFLI